LNNELKLIKIDIFENIKKHEIKYDQLLGRVLMLEATSNNENSSSTKSYVSSD